MAEYLVIRLDADTEQSIQWIAVDSSGIRLSSPETGSLEQAASAAGERDVIVLVPATSALTTTVDMPIRGGARLLAALPFALEEHLADDIDTLHFAPGERLASGLLPVAVVSLANMNAWLARLAVAGITAARIVPENLGLARVPNTLSMLVAEDQILFNDGADNEFVMQGVKPSDVLEVAGVLEDTTPADNPAAGADLPSGHLLVYCEAAEKEKFEHDWLTLRNELASVDINLLPDGVLPRLAVTVAAGHGINLLQGRFGSRTEFAALLRPWRYAAMLLLTLGLVAIGGKAADYYRLLQDEAALKIQFAEEYRAIVPGDDREIVDPVNRVNSVRRSLGAPAASQVFLPSLQALGQALQQNSDAEIEAITYRAGIIDVRLSAPDVATLDSIQRAVSSSGRFSASIQSTDQVGDKISSRIQIQEAGA